MNEPVILLQNVDLTLGAGASRVHVLHDVNLAVGRSESVGLVGPSGSGKSTLLMVIAGLEHIDGGRVAVAGMDYAGLGEDRIARFRGREVGFVFQSFHLMQTMTALENVAAPLELAGRGDAFKRAETMLDRVGLGARLSHYPAQLSGGEQQRVAIARALVRQPRLILADEPTGALDIETGARTMDLLDRVATDAGAALVTITHDRAVASRARRVLELVDGRLHVLEPSGVAS